MAEVSITDLHNHAGDVVDRAGRGESVTVTRSGKPVAQLVALPAPGLTLDELRRRRAALPEVDPAALRTDLDEHVHPSV